MFNDRLIFLFGEITPDLMSEAKKSLVEMATINEPIYIFIDTIGGDQMQAISFVDLVRYFQKEKGIDINTVVSGECLSAGLPLFLCGTNRYCTEYSIFMMHESSISSDEANTKSLASYLKISGKIINKIMVNLLHDTKLSSEEFFKKIKSGEWWFDSKEAKKLGIVHRVI